MAFKLSYAWSPEKAWIGYRTGVSLHSHTSLSKESLDILIEHGARNPVVSWLVEREQQRCARRHGKRIDFGRAYWTSPVTPHEAFSLECRQIEKDLGLHPLVSLTDHDEIEANRLLQLIDGGHEIPISVEWTVPFENTFFHFGVHNLPKNDAAALHRAMQAHRKSPASWELVGLLQHLVSNPGVVVILNHPLWDEAGIGIANHEALLSRLLQRTKGLVHALELNGLRPWTENRKVVRIAESCGIPAVSGGDRHGFEPNALVNVSNAASFCEFAEQIRAGHSYVLLMPQYRENRKLRCLQTAWDMIREHPQHAFGQVTCFDRSYFIRENGEAVALSSLFTDGTPPTIARVLRAFRFLECPQLRPALRVALSDREGLPS